MNKKTLFFVIALATLSVLGIILMKNSDSENKPQPIEATQQSAEEAIRQAKEYQPEGNCTDALVPAVHKETGAEYTFKNGCLAPGWEAAI